jgi:hypothetical protein
LLDLTHAFLFIDACLNTNMLSWVFHHYQYDCKYYPIHVLV